MCSLIISTIFCNTFFRFVFRSVAHHTLPFSVTFWMLRWVWAQYLSNLFFHISKFIKISTLAHHCTPSSFTLVWAHLPMLSTLHECNQQWVCCQKTLYILPCPATFTVTPHKLSHLTHTPPRTAVCINMYVCRLVTLVQWSWLLQCSTKEGHTQLHAS